MKRRELLGVGAALLAGGCSAPAQRLEGGFAGIDMVRGHALRERLAGGPWPEPARSYRTRVVIAGGGVAGLAAARALRLAGEADYALLELEDQPGGNSRAGSIHGLGCPLGAHYLPLPGDGAPEVQDLLEELGLRQRVAGRWQYDEQHLCHSPQERLYFQGEWVEGLLPVQGVSARSLEQYRTFARLVDELGRMAPFRMPTFVGWRSGQALHSAHGALDAMPFAAWLDRQGLDDAHLRWYLDYCCRDDYGAGAARVSAWAGIHYFASRHGFHAPGDGAAEERDGVLTWPEGNGWLTQRLARAPQQGGQLHTGVAVLRITENRHGVEIDTYHHGREQVERWQADRCVVALPVMLAARVVQQPPAFLAEARQRLVTAPWLVTNLHLNSPVRDRPGAAPAWDNVIYADPATGGLGYVNAGHQRLDPRATLAGPTVLTYYQALGDRSDTRQALAREPWTHWVEAALASLSVPHPDLRQHITRAEVTRYGHAMAIPVPGMQSFLSQIGTYRATDRRRVLSNGERQRVLPTPSTARLAFAHADWSGYSVFEEAFTRGHAAGLVSLSNAG